MNNRNYLKESSDMVSFGEFLDLESLHKIGEKSWEGYCQTVLLADAKPMRLFLFRELLC